MTDNLFLEVKQLTAGKSFRERVYIATVAINGGANAGILAAKILATSDPELLGKLKEYTESLKENVIEKDEKLQQVGYRDYTN